VTEPDDRRARGVLVEAAVIDTENGPRKRVTIRSPRAVDEETGTIIKTLRSLYFDEIYRGGEVVSEPELLAMWDSRVEVHFLPGNAAEIRVMDDEGKS